MNDVADGFARLRQSYVTAVAQRDVKALVQLYDPDALIFDAWGVWEYHGIESWQAAVEGWLSSNPRDRFEVSFSERKVHGNSALATMTAIVSYAGFAADGTESHSMHNRITWIVTSSGGDFRIVHEHTSAPIGFADMKAILKRPA